MSRDVVDLKMYFHLTDITFIPDEAIEAVIDQYYSNTSTLELPDAGEIAQQVKKNAPKGLLNRSLLNRLCQAPACFADPSFWSIAGFDRRFRWFDHHLSFSGGELHLYATSSSLSSTRTVEQQEDFVTCDDVVRQQRIDSVVNEVMNNLLPTLDPEPELDLSMVGDHTDLLSCLEKVIIEGRFTGRTVEEIKVGSFKASCMILLIP
ncbi:unnamed protein product [Dicrocoelium dendriticum]|nr:unnamed protein product [Dicrocoelium dendriticum]